MRKFFTTCWYFVFPVITEEWCVVGSAIGAPRWRIQKRKCRNGHPVGAGGFLHIVKCNNVLVANSVVQELNSDSARPCKPPELDEAVAEQARKECRQGNYKDGETYLNETRSALAGRSSGATA